MFAMEKHHRRLKFVFAFLSLVLVTWIIFGCYGDNYVVGWGNTTQSNENSTDNTAEQRQNEEVAAFKAGETPVFSEKP